MIMQHTAGRFPFSVGSYVLFGLMCIALFFGCADNHIIPANKLVSGKVTLSWDNIPGAVSYNIYFAGQSGLTKWNSNKITNASNPITVTDLAFGKTFYFGIAVVRESGESGILSEKSYTVTDQVGFIKFDGLMPASQALKGQETKKQLPDGSVTLTWENVPDAVSYNIYWSESPGVTRRNGNKIANVTNPYTMKGLRSGKTYYFVVTAVSNSGESKESEELSFSVK